MENSGTIKNARCIYVYNVLKITGGEITANSALPVLSLNNGASLELTGGTVTQEDSSGYVILYVSADAALPEAIGTQLRGKGTALLRQNGADVTNEKGYQAELREDGYYYLVKKEENP